MAGKKGMRQPGSDRVDTWVPRYLAGESTVDIALEAGITHRSVAMALRRRGVAMRPILERAHREYTCDERYFDTIDSEEKAYWLGFLAADGNIHRRTLSLWLSAKDAEHVGAFVDAISGTQPVKLLVSTSEREMAAVTINSLRLIAALVAHGIVPRKSLVLEWPAGVPEHLEVHFLRGYIDGDGSWRAGRQRTGRPNWSICLLGTPSFLRRAQSIMSTACGLGMVSLYRTKAPGTMTLQYTGNQQTARIAHWLYDGATVYLLRKKARADAVITEAAKTPQHATH